jgi:hypothetical protein
VINVKTDGMDAESTTTTATAGEKDAAYHQFLLSVRDNSSRV